MHTDSAAMAIREMTSLKNTVEPRFIMDLIARVAFSRIMAANVSTNTQRAKLNSPLPALARSWHRSLKVCSIPGPKRPR
jgi:hypothetical protein